MWYLYGPWSSARSLLSEGQRIEQNFQRWTRCHQHSGSVGTQAGSFVCRQWNLVSLFTGAAVPREMTDDLTNTRDIDEAKSIQQSVKRIFLQLKNCLHCWRSRSQATCKVGKKVAIEIDNRIFAHMIFFDQGTQLSLEDVLAPPPPTWSPAIVSGFS